MKICYFDAWSGISGDMTVGALVDAGAPADAIREGLNSLNTGRRSTLSARHGEGSQRPAFGSTEANKRTTATFLRF